VHRFLFEIPNLSRDQWDLIGSTWRHSEDLPPLPTPNVNAEIAAVVSKEKFRPTLAWLVEAIREEAGPEQDDLVIQALRMGVRARNRAAKYTFNRDATDAVAGMMMVLVLKAFLSDSLIAIVEVPFSAVRPGWPLGNGASRGDDLHADSSRTEPDIESLPFFGTTWYRRGFSYWVRRAGLSLFVFGLVAFDLVTVSYTHLTLPTICSV